jgi:cell wall-associated NlpC family hydrolase
MKNYLFLLSCFTFFCSCDTLKKTTIVNTTDTASIPKKTYVTYVPNVKNKKLYAACKEWLGVPYKYGGTTKAGTDCSALVNMIYKEAYNKNLYRTSKEMYDRYYDVKYEDIQEGDLLFFSYTSKYISHVGVYLADGKYIHASTKKGVMISKLTDDWNKKYFIRAGRP